MTETIREKIFDSIESKLQTILISNGYNLDMGKEAFRSFLPPLDYSVLPAVGFLPLFEESISLHGERQKANVQIQIQGVAKFGTVLPGQMAELIFADILENVLGTQWTIGFDSGGPFRAVVGATIIGETSAATGYICGVDVSGGTWSGEDAAGNFSLRRVSGEFLDDEQINIDENDDVCNIDGVLSGQGPVKTLTNSLADSIEFVSAVPQFPNQDQNSVGMTVVFNCKYGRIAGNPYSQKI